MFVFLFEKQNKTKRFLSVSFVVCQFDDVSYHLRHGSQNAKSHIKTSKGVDTSTTQTYIYIS